MRERPGSGIQAEEILKLAIDRRLLIGQRILQMGIHDTSRITKSNHPNLGNINQRSNDTLPLDPKSTGIDRKSNQGRTGSADDLRLLHHRAKEAQNRKARALRELEENHPFFDRPLFIFKRTGRVRRLCKMIVSGSLYKTTDQTRLDSVYYTVIHCNTHCV